MAALRSLPCPALPALRLIICQGTANRGSRGKKKANPEAKMSRGGGEKGIKGDPWVCGVARASLVPRAARLQGRACKQNEISGGFRGGERLAAGPRQHPRASRPAPVSCPLGACPHPPTCNEGARWHGLRNAPAEHSLRSPSLGPAPRVSPGFLRAGGQKLGFLQPLGKREHGQS